MHITIEDKTVSENLQAFINVLRKAEARREKTGAALFEKRYKAFLHRHMGTLIFADAFGDHSSFDGHIWKPLFIDYAFDTGADCFHATAYEDAEGRDAFELADLSPHAVHAIKETLLILNRLSWLVRGSQSDILTKIKALCKLQIDVGPLNKDKNLLVAAWHSLDRLGAERALKDKPVGTFLFREDPFAKLLSEQLSQKMGKTVKCVTLTVSEPEEKVSDFTLVHIDHQWRWYDEALFCAVEGFPEIDDLLQAYFKDLLKEPLYHSFIERISA